MEQVRQMFKEEGFFGDHLLLYVNRAVEDFILPLHSHEFIELAYVAEGKGFHYIEEEVQRIHRGQLHVIPIGTSHVFRPTSMDAARDPLIVYNCIFPKSLIDRLMPLLIDEPVAAYIEGLKEETRSYHAVFDADAEIERLFLLLYKEYSLPRSGSTTYLNTLLLQLIVTIYRLHTDTSHAIPSQPARFLQLLSYLEQNYAEKLTLAHLSGRFQWSERHLQRLFKRHTGQGFNYYLQSLRIQKSCEQLRSTQLKISRIAESVGYKDLSSFMVVFRRIVGQTPGAYRQTFNQSFKPQPD
ncbi:AraC family transcriptional regulator [Paenibacillus nasutitermitis]|uniref:AraC family transcriptional regulator n=1 Tax=Paenibacillus nasutitermitis TaxID=1652958 RepID=A0A916Z517_9BACL|nr:AraC family transcriptional regulator [Paenibacillus nasutitermitis]GGD76867.1 AraC family transcriptional regulator [Paenibacillus nasutitermitis]